MTEKCIARLSAAAKQYADQTWALRDIDLEISAGEILGLVGANGSGKSTLLSILAGQSFVTSGTLQLFEQSVTQSRSAALRRRIGLAGQDQALDPEMTVRETLNLFANLYRIPRIESARVKQQSIDALELNALLQKRVSHLSGGQRQRLHLAIAVLQQPRLLLMDEPTTALDPAMRLKLWQNLRAFITPERAIVVATHDLSDAEQYFDRMVIMASGKILARGTPEQLRRDHAKPRIEVKIAEGTRFPENLETDIAGLSGVDTASLNARVINVRLNNSSNSTLEVIEYLKHINLNIVETREYAATLEEAYYGIVGRPLQSNVSRKAARAGRRQRMEVTSE